MRKKKGYQKGLLIIGTFENYFYYLSTFCNKESHKTFGCPFVKSVIFIFDNGFFWLFWLLNRWNQNYAKMRLWRLLMTMVLVSCWFVVWSLFGKVEDRLIYGIFLFKGYEYCFVYIVGFMGWMAWDWLLSVEGRNIR